MMADQKRGGVPGEPNKQAEAGANRWLGSLRDALASAKSAERQENAMAAQQPPRPGHIEHSLPPILPAAHMGGDDRTHIVQRQASAAMMPPPVPRAAQGAVPPRADRTTLVRGKQKVARTSFHSDPVVGWLVIVGGPGLGAYRPIYEGNNTIGRTSGQRIALDFGDDSISAEEQAYIRYDSSDRNFLFVPNLTKTNVVAINDRKPTGAVNLAAMDVITMGRTQLAFVPFCGQDFDWAEISSMKE